MCGECIYYRLIVVCVSLSFFKKQLCDIVKKVMGKNIRVKPFFLYTGKKCIIISFDNKQLVIKQFIFLTNAFFKTRLAAGRRVAAGQRSFDYMCT